MMRRSAMTSPAKATPRTGGRPRLAWALGLGAALAVSGASCDSDPAPRTVAMSGTIGDFAPAAGLKPLEGVEVCTVEQPEVACATTDAAGHYALVGLPAGEDLLITYEKEGYLPQLGMLSTGSSDVGPVEIRLAPTGAAEPLFTIIGATYPLGDTGGITFGAYPSTTGGGIGPEDGLAGYSVALAPSSGVGPVYVNEQEFPDTAQTDTAAPGWGLYANIAPGTVALTFTKDGKPCDRVRPGYGWESSLSGGTLQMPIVAGYLTAGAVLCDP